MASKTERTKIMWTKICRSTVVTRSHEEGYTLRRLHKVLCRVPKYPRVSWKRTWKVDCVRDDGESDHPEWLCVSEVGVDFPNSLEDQGGARPDGLDVHNCLWVWASATFREKGRHRSVVYDLLYAVFKFRIRSGSSLAQFYSASFFQPRFSCFNIALQAVFSAIFWAIASSVLPK